MANDDPFIIVNVGKVEWLSLKFTPFCLSEYKFGVSVALTESGLSPSQTMMMVLVGPTALGVESELQPTIKEALINAAIKAKIFMIFSPKLRLN